MSITEKRLGLRIEPWVSLKQPRARGFRMPQTLWPSATRRKPTSASSLSMRLFSSKPSQFLKTFPRRNWEKVSSRTNTLLTPPTRRAYTRVRPVRIANTKEPSMSRSPAKPWGKRDLITLRSAARRREPVKSVAKRLGRTTAATQQKAMRMGWQFRQTV